MPGIGPQRADRTRKMGMGPAGRFRWMRMVARVSPADVGLAWFWEAVPKIDAGALTFGCPPVAS